MKPLLMAAAVIGAGAYEEPGFFVVKEYDGFEVRRYARYVAIETDASGDFEASRNKAFRRLFAYISGCNVAGGSLDTPAELASDRDCSGEKIAMTVPVTTQTSDEGSVMQFVLPARYSLDTAPRPIDARVRLRPVGQRLVAARRFSGRTTEANYRAQEATLLRQLRAANLQTASEPVFAVYNGPFTPWFMRRNEVLVTLSAVP